MPQRRTAISGEPGRSHDLDGLRSSATLRPGIGVHTNREDIGLVVMLESHWPGATTNRPQGELLLYQLLGPLPQQR